MKAEQVPVNDIAKKIALITGGNIHNGERETSLPFSVGVNERVIAMRISTSRDLEMQ